MFDIIGDVHGCLRELGSLLDRLGYGKRGHPDGRTAVFVGDLVDRGPSSVGVLRRVMSMVDAGDALSVVGNHDDKLARWLHGRNVKVGRGLQTTVSELKREGHGFRKQVRDFIDELPEQLILDEGNLVIAHAGLPEHFHGRKGNAVRAFALYGDPTGEVDEDGLPIRRDWAKDYRGKAAVVYGHTPHPEPEWVHNTICVDTGVVYGGRLTALRYPERELVSVPALKAYWERGSA